MPTLPTSKSFDSISLGLLGLPRAYLSNKQIIGTGPTGTTSGLPANQQIIGWAIIIIIIIIFIFIFIIFIILVIESQ